MRNILSKNLKKENEGLRDAVRVLTEELQEEVRISSMRLMVLHSERKVLKKIAGVVFDRERSKFDRIKTIQRMTKIYGEYIDE